jgi:hypothetical protein
MDAQSKDVLLAILDFNTQLTASDPLIMNTIDTLKSYGLDGDENNTFFEGIKNYVISTILDSTKIQFIKDVIERIGVENRLYIGSLAEILFMDITQKTEFLAVLQSNYTFPSSTEEYDYYKAFVNRVSQSKDTELIQAVRDRILAI